MSWATLVMLATAVAGVSEEWIDPDTPESKRTLTVRGKKHVLVFSDEFEVEGRSFQDGRDPVWTALVGAPNTNEQYNAYNDSLAYTRKGRLVLETTPNTWTDPANANNVRRYQTAMIQVRAPPAMSSGSSLDAQGQGSHFAWDALTVCCVGLHRGTGLPVPPCIPAVVEQVLLHRGFR